MQVTLALIKPTVCVFQPHIRYVLQRIREHPTLHVLRTRSFQWTAEEAATFYHEHQGKFYYDRLLLGMTSGRAMGLAVVGPRAIQQWRELIGPTKAYRTAWEQPDCLRAELGLGDTRNGFHGSDSHESAMKELAHIFPTWNAQAWLRHHS